MPYNLFQPYLNNKTSYCIKLNKHSLYSNGGCFTIENLHFAKQVIQRDEVNLFLIVYSLQSFERYSLEDSIFQTHFPRILFQNRKVIK